MTDRPMPAPSEPASSRPDPEDLRNLDIWVASGDPDLQISTTLPAGEVVTLTCVVDDADALSDLAWAHGATGIAELSDEYGPGSVRLVIGAADAEAAAHLVAALADDGRSVIESVALADDAWADSWRAHATTHRAGPFGIRLPDHLPTEATFDIVIEPGRTFGYGHPTTLLALELLAKVGGPLGRVLDIGTGSGVLAIAASQLGADEVTAVDIDPDAVTACRANATRNNATVAVTCADAGSELPTAPPEGYDVVLVNVTAAVQIAVADIVAAVAGSAATLVVSGILAHQESTVIAAHAPVAVIDRREQDGWVALVLRRRPPSPAPPSVDTSPDE
jgi:ribosomal protein L11 methylase PrmA